MTCTHSSYLQYGVLRWFRWTACFEYLHTHYWRWRLDFTKNSQCQGCMTGHWVLSGLSYIPAANQMICTRSSVRFRLKPDNSNSHEFELHRPSNKGTKLLLKVIKAIIIIMSHFIGHLTCHFGGNDLSCSNNASKMSSVLATRNHESFSKWRPVDELLAIRWKITFLIPLFSKHLLASMNCLVYILLYQVLSRLKIRSSIRQGILA